MDGLASSTLIKDYPRSSGNTSCNEHYSAAKKTQRSIKKIVNCGLKEMGELPFDFHYGTCGTYNFPDERIFLCFGDDAGKKCQR